MARVLDLFSYKLKPYATIIMVVVLIIIFIVASYYGFKKLYKEKHTSTDYSNSHNQNSAGTKTITIYYFFADWCPHCKKTRGDWNAFASDYNGKVVNGYNIICHDEDCSNRDSPTELQTRYNAFQYPTVKAVKPDGNDEIEIMFDSKISKTNLEKFVDSICKE